MQKKLVEKNIELRREISHWSVSEYESLVGASIRFIAMAVSTMMD